MKNDDSADESPIDRELRRALDVTPSPEFAARVRMRIASEPASTPWFRPRLVMAGVSVAVAVVVGVLVVPREQPSQQSANVALSSRPPVALSPAGFGTVALNPAGPDSVALSPTGRDSVARGPSGSPAAALHPVPLSEPEVLVSPAEMRGLLRLIALANLEDPSLESLLAAPTDPTPISAIEPDEIVIAPITIEPLASDTQ